MRARGPGRVHYAWVTVGIILAIGVGAASTSIERPVSRRLPEAVVVAPAPGV